MTGGNVGLLAACAAARSHVTMCVMGMMMFASGTAVPGAAPGGAVPVSTKMKCCEYTPMCAQKTALERSVDLAQKFATNLSVWGMGKRWRKKAFAARDLSAPNPREERPKYAAPAGTSARAPGARTS